MLLAPCSQRTVEETIAAGPALVQAARAAGVACFAASLVEGPAVLLGCHQRAARVLDLAAADRTATPIHRRRTSGTAAYAAGRALVFSLALPRVGALFPDATFRTLLNRNVRPFLKGLTAAGAVAHYFGREWLSARRRPAVLLGFDVEPDGAVLIEAIVGFDQAMGIPPALAAEDERALDRYGGRSPAALADLLPPGATPEGVARAIADAFAARAPAPSSERRELLAPIPPESARADRTAPDPVPPGAELLLPARVPIGWLERARLPDRAALWLGGDVLAPRALLDRAAAAAAGGAEAAWDSADPPLDGVTLAELTRSACPQ